MDCDVEHENLESTSEINEDLGEIQARRLRDKTQCDDSREPHLEKMMRSVPEQDVGRLFSVKTGISENNMECDDIKEVDEGVPDMLKDNPEKTKMSIRKWLLLGGLFMVSFIELGSIRTLSLILGDITYQYGMSTSYISAIYGIVSGIYAILAFLGTNLLHRFSVRQLCMMGGAISSCGLIIASFTQTVPQVTAALLAFGTGYIFIIIPAYTCLETHFSDRFEVATGIATSGGSSGVMVLPWIFEIILNKYGWRGTLLILGGFNLHFLVVGALIVPAKSAHTKKTKKIKGSTGLKDTALKAHDNVSSTSGPNDAGNMTKPTMSRNERLETICQKVDDHTQHHGYDGGLSWDASDLAADVSSSPKSTRLTGHDNFSFSSNSFDVIKTEEALVQNENDLATSFGKSAGPVQRRARNVENSADMAIVVTPRRSTPVGDDVKTRKGDCLWTCLLKVVTITGLRIFRERPMIIIVCLQILLFSVPYATWLLFTIPNAQAKGLTDLRSAQISLAGGIANFFGRFASGFVFSRNVLRVEVWYLLANAITAAAFFVNFFSDPFWSLTILSVVFGFMMGFSIPTIFVLMKNAAGRNHYKAGLALLSLSYGVAFPLAGFVAGKIYDGTQSYNISFCIMGGLALAAGVAVIMPLLGTRVGKILNKCACSCV